MFAAVGRHPNEAHGFDDADLAELPPSPNIPAVSRSARPASTITGRTPRADDQRRAFVAQIALAQKTGTPLTIHTRNADEDTLATLAAEAEGLKVVIHCFSMPDRLQECVDRGYYVSFAGNVTYKSAGDLAEAARLTPAERLLIETDAPYLSPHIVRKHRNQPAYVAHTAAFIAELRGVSVDELGALVERNAERVFGW